MLDVESGEPTEVTEAHSFADGVCTVCGQAASQPTEAPSVQSTEAPSVQPTVAPDVTVAPTARAEAAATPAPTEEPVYEEVPAEEPVHGVKAEDKIPMVETLSTVAEALKTEEAQVDAIANVEEIVTPEEKAALDQLPLREQMLTVLCAIGFEEQVTEALAGEGVSLSEEAGSAEGADSGPHRRHERGRKGCFPADAGREFPRGDGGNGRRGIPVLRVRGGNRNRRRPAQGAVRLPGGSRRVDFREAQRGGNGKIRPGNIGPGGAICRGIFALYAARENHV